MHPYVQTSSQMAQFVLTKRYTAPLDVKWALHPILLAGWGTPIGELSDLESLAKAYKRLKRWTFFFVSIPLN
jgi:hypothetical protein